MKIGFDIDGVIADFTNTFLPFHDTMHCKQNNVDHWDRWMLEECENMDVSSYSFMSAFTAFNDYRMWQAVKPIPYAKETLCILESMGAKISYITARPNGSERATLKFILQNGFPITDILFRRDKEKSVVAKQLGFDLVIEDKPETLVAYKEAEIDTIAVRYKYNEDVISQHNITYIDDIRQMVKIVKEKMESS